MPLKKLFQLKRNPFRELEKKLGYTFKDKTLLGTALTHPSYRFETAVAGEDNQRLEFLGDAALGLAAAAYIYRHYTREDEGRLTILRSRLTNGKTLAHIARQLGLGDMLSLGKGENMSGGRNRDSVLADALEAVLGAVYLDAKQAMVDKIIAHLFVPYLSHEPPDSLMENPKGQLQALSQKKWGEGPRYRVIEEAGPLHSRLFTVEVSIDGKHLAQGTASSKREAEARAAAHLLRLLNSPRK